MVFYVGQNRHSGEFLHRIVLGRRRCKAETEGAPVLYISQAKGQGNKAMFYSLEG